tara:strand:- start:178 stop:369 length:192 start_codon:yes stop_codon:yes gene_type:complete
MDEQKISEMKACFLSLERKDLVEYLNFMIGAIQHEEVIFDSDEEVTSEELEVQVDDDGFYSLK